MVPPGVTLRRFDDYPAARQMVFDNAAKAFTESFPIENENFRITVSDLAYDPKKFGIRDAKKAKLSGGRLSVPLRGTVTLFGKESGQPLDKKEGVVLANVPWMTDRGTFIINGNEYSHSSQSRLKAGIFARRKENGELESHFNTKNGTGPQFRVFMEPETGIFRAEIQKSSIRLYPVLKLLGVGDREMEDAWGRGVLEENRRDDDKVAPLKFYKKFLGNRAEENPTPEVMRQSIRDAFSRAEFSDEVTERTLGKAHPRLSERTLLESTKKLLDISRGQAEEDDRDSLANKTFHSVEDLMAERVTKDAGQLRRALLWKVGRTGTLEALRPGHFSPYFDEQLVGNPLSTFVGGVNPIDLLDQSHKVTLMGPGGINSDEAISLSSRNVHPSQIGVTDPIRTAESGRVGVDQRFTSRAMKGSDGHIYFPLKEKKTGKVVMVDPVRFSKSVVAFSRAPDLDMSDDVLQDSQIEDGSAIRLGPVAPQSGMPKAASMRSSELFELALSLVRSPKR